MSGDGDKLQVALGPLRLRNPVMTASGTFGYGREYAPFVDLNRLGAIVVKGVSIDPWAGNDVPRIAETACGMLNSIGLQNPGVDHFLRVDLPYLREFDTAVIVNVIGRTAADYAEAAARLDGADGVAAIEVNISCPNVRRGGIEFGTDPAAASLVVGAMRKATTLPLIPKLSPNATDITAMARALEDAGANALSLVNTFRGMSIDIRRRRPTLATTFGGLSGPAIKPLALRLVWEVFEAVKLPLIGMGGIMNGDDAVEFILAGATAVAVGTATFVNPRAAGEVLAGIETYCAKTGVGAVTDLVGAAHGWEECIL